MADEKSNHTGPTRPDIEQNASGQRDSGVPLTTALGIDSKAFIDTWGDILETSLQHPAAMWNVTRQLASQYAEIIT